MPPPNGGPAGRITRRTSSTLQERRKGRRFAAPALSSILENMINTQFALLLIIAFARCGGEPAPKVTSEPADTVRGVVDSIFPVEEEIRRFKAARNGATATGLSNASESRNALVQRLMTALEKLDSADLRLMVINPAEFIELYYPTSIYSHPPFKQSPELVWFLLEQNSEKGIKRALDRFGGMPTHFQNYTCADTASVRQSNKLWEGCTVVWAPAPGAPSPVRLFGTILERGGRFKFLSYANDF